MNQTVYGHLQELRRRLMWSALVVLAGAAGAYFFRNAILGWLQAPLSETLYYSKVTGAFEFIMQACLLVGALVAAPVLTYQLIAFIRPALPRPITRTRVASIIIIAMALIVSGVAFGYYISLPAALHFLSSIDTSHLHPLIAADSYLTFVMVYLAVFGVIFLLPLVFISIDHLTPLPPTKLRKARKWVIVGAFGAALILPVAPDPLSQVLLAMPIVAMYEVSIWLMALNHRLKRSKPQVNELPRAAVPPQSRPVPVPSTSHSTPVARTPARLRPAVIDLRGR